LRRNIPLLGHAACEMKERSRSGAVGLN